MQEAEIKAKKMEEEINRLHKSLEDRHGQLRASASTSEKVLVSIPPLWLCMCSKQIDFVLSSIMGLRIANLVCDDSSFSW